jgi:hypothetical protein
MVSKKEKHYRFIYKTVFSAEGNKCGVCQQNKKPAQIESDLRHEKEMVLKS